MKKIFRTFVLLAGAACMATSAIHAQQAHALIKPASLDLALTYAPEHGQQTGSTDGLWFEGGGFDATALYGKN